MHFVVKKRKKTEKLAAAEATEQLATAVWLNFSHRKLKENVDKLFVINRAHLDQCGKLGRRERERNFTMICLITHISLIWFCLL